MFILDAKKETSEHGFICLILPILIRMR